MISLREDSGAAMRSSFEQEIEKIFSPDGRLSAAANFEYRPDNSNGRGGAGAQSRSSSKPEQIGKSLAYVSAVFRGATSANSYLRTPSLSRSSSRIRIFLVQKLLPIN
jgi:hypothetical protein